MHTSEGCSSISDLNGNLLFYSDGDTVWNKLHQPMPNGTGLKGCYSSAQSCIIVPKPKSSNLYYIFTVDCGENSGNLGLRYSIIDMNLDAGKGDVNLSNKNILLHSPCTEGITAISVCDSLTWLASHDYNNNTFRIYKININGVNSVPVISQIGSVYNDYVVYMRFSPNAEMLASCYTYGDELYNFNSVTGAVSNSISLTFSLTTGYCPVFSNNNTKLYISNNGDRLFQYDVSFYNANAINTSKTLLSQITSFADNSSFWAISNGPDGKIYVASYDKDTLSSILNPNLLGTNCNFSKNNIPLNSKNCQLGLPDFSQSYFNTLPNNCPTSDIYEKNKIISNIKVSLLDNNILIENATDFNFDILVFNIYGQFIIKDFINSFEEKKISLNHFSNAFIFQLKNSNQQLNYKFIKN